MKSLWGLIGIGALENHDVLELSHVTNFNDDKNTKNLGLKTLTPTNTSINASPHGVKIKRKSPDSKNALKPLAMYNRFNTAPKINGTIKSPSIAAAIKSQSPPKKMISALTKDVVIPNYTETNDENIPPPPTAPPLPPKSLPKSATARKRKPKRIKTLGWIPLPDNKIESTFWKEGSSQVSDLKSLVDNDFEELFAVKPSLSRTNSLKQLNPANKSLLSIQRSNNIAIVVSSFKMSIPELMECICCFDDKVLTIEKLKQLRSILPADDELKMLKSYTGDISMLGKAEQFIDACSRVPHLRATLEFFQLKQQLSDIVQDISSGINIVLNACEEVKLSEKFQRILQWVLTFGSIMNEGTYLLSKGFKLESLTKLSDIKSVEQNTTLLHYLVSVLHRKMPELLKFYEDLPNVPKAANISVDTIFLDLNNLKDSQKRLEEELLLCNEEEKTTNLFYPIMKVFNNTLKLEISQLYKQMEMLAVVYKDLATYFGENNSNEKFSKTFFQNLNTFITNFERAVKDSKFKKQ